ncbi:UDP-glucosyltransferase 2-like [Schistocerca nitens]|uniref:UDP-glucosyltransferase 2-like n=1 Tax=Schistocerca nitens TaxID=7011 RepID=UPI0021188471|nr:UDP-glucosyltransferase 2-like [Schistocerca nitens]
MSGYLYEKALATLLLLWLMSQACCSSKILVVCPSPSISHQKPFHILTKALLQRGHQVTFFTANPLKISHENLTEIDLSVGYNIIGELDFVKMASQSPAESISFIRSASRTMVPWQLNEPAVQDFLKRNHTFDVMIMERILYQGYYGLAHRVGSPPLVGMVTLAAFSPLYYAMGNPMNPAYAPDVWLGFSDHMTFWERVYNVFFYLRCYYLWFWETFPEQDAIMRQYFGPDLPSVYETDRNFSLLIVNSHFSMEYPRPHLPNIIEVTGVHVETQAKPLPKRIQEFMDGAANGVIYLSLGSNVKSNALPWDKVQAFLDAFREVPQRVLWKWENDSLPGQPDNVMISKWLPQQDVLAHPKLVLFVTQGGLQSMNEATYHAVPFLVIPFFSDQDHNAAKIQQAGIGLWLKYSDVTKDTVLHGIRAVLGDTEYRENMRTLSSIFREHQADSVERAVWWVEYVIRHKGAPHMRSAALDLHWWQLLLLDVIAFLLLAVAAVAGALFCLARRLFIIARPKEKKH